jgi:glycosyltransferase involved in cell wall biosynthesis
MRIVRLTTSLDFGGQEKKYISFTNIKNRLLNQYVFAAIGRGGYAEQNLKTKGFEVYIFNRNPSVVNFFNIFILYRRFRRIKPDIVHTAAAEANFHGILAARLAGVKIVIAEEIGFPSHSLKAQLVFSIIYRLVRVVVCVSEAVRDFLVEIGEIPAEKGVVIYNPVSPSKHVKREIQPYFTIVTVGRLETVKNHRLLLEVLAELSDKSIRLILVGDGSERPNLEETIDQLNLKEQVWITGFISEPEQFLAKADLFVLPSLSEGFGIAAVEAMQMGVPSLCSKVGGIPEFIEDGKNGWLFDPHDKSELIAKIELILEMDREKRDTVGMHGRSSVADRFSEERYIEILEGLYEELARGD